MKNSKIYIFGLALILLVYPASATSIQILDPTANSTLTRGDEGKIMVTYLIEGDASNCWYTHYNTPEVNIPLNCSGGMNDILTSVVFSGLHSFEIYANDTDGKLTSELVQFTVFKDKNIEKAPPVNLDTLSCIDTKNCFWDNPDYLTLVFGIAVLGIVYFAAKEMD